MSKYQNKYRIPSARAPFWDYGWNAAYFVTICTHNRMHWFGEIVNGEMILSDIGKIAQQCWLEIPQHFPFVKLDAFVVMPNHIHGILIIDKPETHANPDHNSIPPVETQNFASLNPNMHAPSETQNIASLHPNIPACIESDFPPEFSIFINPDYNSIPPVETQNIASLHSIIHAPSETQDIASLHSNMHAPSMQYNNTQNKFGAQSQNLASIIRGFKIGVTKNARMIHPNFKWQARYHDHIIRNEDSWQTISNYILNNPAQWEEDILYTSKHT